MTAEPALVLAAHGSRDAGFEPVIDALAVQVRQLRPSLEVSVGYLEHGKPALADAVTAGSVVVPVLLTSGYHVSTDIPRHAQGCIVAAALGPDQRIAAVLADRLRAAGWREDCPVVLAAAGSTDPAALDDVRHAARDLAAVLGVPVTAAYLSAGEPRVADLDLREVAVATYLLGQGHFAAVVAGCGAPVIAAPLGPDPRLAEVLLDRYDAALHPRSGTIGRFAGAKRLNRARSASRMGA